MPTIRKCNNVRRKRLRRIERQRVFWHALWMMRRRKHVVETDFDFTQGDYPVMRITVKADPIFDALDARDSGRHFDWDDP